MALTEHELAAVTATVRDRIAGTVLGRDVLLGGSVEMEIAGAAVIFCCGVAPDAPEAILREASIRLAGWIYGNRPHVSEHEYTDPSGSSIKLRFNNSAATANGFRSSGASALLSRYIKRRGGLIDGTSERATGTVATPVSDIGTTVMRLGFARALPFMDDGFRWIGTANGVEIDTAHSQPAAFGFWLPGNVMDRVVEVVLLRLVQFSLSPDVVNLAAFGPAIEYQFGDTAGMLRHTAVTFDGNFSLPNDFRAVLGEPR